MTLRKNTWIRVATFFLLAVLGLGAIATLGLLLALSLPLDTGQHRSLYSNADVMRGKS